MMINKAQVVRYSSSLERKWPISDQGEEKLETEKHPLRHHACMHGKLLHLFHDHHLLLTYFLA